MGSSIAEYCDLEAAETDTSCFHKNWPGIISTVAWAVSEKPDISIDLGVGLWNGSRSVGIWTAPSEELLVVAYLGRRSSWFPCSLHPIGIDNIVSSFAQLSTQIILHCVAIHLIYSRASSGSY